MKKTLVFSILITLLSFTGHTQDIQFGLKTGLNFSRFSSDDTSINQMSYNRTAFQIGGLVAFKVSDNLSIQPELYYSSEGGSFKDTEVEENSIVHFNTNVNTNYISLPIMVKYFVNKSVFLEAGAQMDFLVSANAKTTISNNFEAEVEEIEDFQDGLDSNSYGVGIGIGYQAANGIFINTRYVLGLSDITKNEFTTIKNNGFHFSVGFML